MTTTNVLVDEVRAGVLVDDTHALTNGEPEYLLGVEHADGSMAWVRPERVRHLDSDPNQPGLWDAA